jgi:hypothetical protein
MGKPVIQTFFQFNRKRRSYPPAILTIVMTQNRAIKPMIAAPTAIFFLSLALCKGPCGIRAP